MTNPTSNFGWQMPTSTDLVTDLPADFAVFGQAVDTSMADLKGGTTGQILSKATATDMDFTWITNDVGDITAVTAGTGISGGGTSGAVTITNSMATEITAKGDLIAGTGSATFDNLGVGTNGQVLTADSTVSPTGLKWATPASGTTFSGALALKTADQTIPNTTNTTLSFNTETNGYDTDNYHDNTTNNSRMTVPSGKTGYYWVWVNVTWAPNSTGRRICRILKSGAVFFIMEATPTSAASQEPTIIGGKAFYATAGEYFELDVYQNTGGNLDVYGSQAYNTQFGIYYLGA